MHPLAEMVTNFISKKGLLNPGERVGLAVSGGADSVALLRLMVELRAELGVVVGVAHFNHKLRGLESEADERFVEELARQHGLEFFRGSGDAGAHACAKHLSLETAARSLRYDFFLEVMRTARLSKIATAHTLDDQAETVLLKLARGAGTRGLAGIYPKLAMGFASETLIIRPLLGVRRLDVENYLRGLGQGWREDKSNRDLRHFRNVVRHGILPRLERNLNPAIRETLAETAEIARAEEEYWTEKVSDVLPTILRTPELSSRAKGDLPPAGELAKPRQQLRCGGAPFLYSQNRDSQDLYSQDLDSQDLDPQGADPQGLDRQSLDRQSLDRQSLDRQSLDRQVLSAQPLAVQRRVIRGYAESLGFTLEFKHVEQVIGMLSDNQSVALPGGWKAHLTARGIQFQRAVSPPLRDYEYVLAVPGKIEVPEAGACFEAALVRPSEESGYNFYDALDPALIAGELRVRNWRAGDRFWPAHSKSPKKIKELLLDRKITGADRKHVPVVVSGAEVIWLAGFPVPDAFRARDPEAEAVIIHTRTRL